MMFGRAVQLSFVRKQKKAAGEERPIIDLNELDYTELRSIAKDVVKTATVGIIGIGAAFFVMSTAQKVIVNITNPANYR